MTVLHETSKPRLYDPVPGGTPIWRPWLELVLALSVLFFASLTQAQTVVLVHGYMSDPMSWEASGVTPELVRSGWQRGGVLPVPWAGLPELGKGEQRVVYSVGLPFQAPLMVQADQLNVALREVERQRPGDPITLVGHSAGGVVARLALVRGGAGNVERLITIAAPHLGTDRAVQALDATDDSGMFGFVKRFFVENDLGSPLYHTLRASWPVLVDLTPPVPGSLLFWLNGQRHPDIEYVSVVRSPGYALIGDAVVPGFSQDMNNVPALAGRSKVIMLPEGHDLSPLDGQMLANVLAGSD